MSRTKLLPQVPCVRRHWHLWRRSLVLRLRGATALVAQDFSPALTRAISPVTVWKRRGRWSASRGRARLSIADGRPVFGLRSRCGKKLLITWTRMRCPRRKRFAVKPEAERQLLGPARRQEHGFGLAVAVLRPEDFERRAHQVPRRAVRLDVDQAADEVGVRRRRRDPQPELDVADHLDVLFERRRGERQDVGDALRWRAGRAGRGPRRSAGPRQGGSDRTCTCRAPRRGPADRSSAGHPRAGSTREAWTAAATSATCATRSRP